MTQEIVRELVDGVWVTRPKDQGGGGGSSALQLASVPLTNAQIKTLTTTGVEIVAAQAAGKTIWPIAAILLADTSGDAYTGLVEGSATMTLGVPNTIGFSMLCQATSAAVEAMLAQAFTTRITMASILTSPSNGQVEAFAEQQNPPTWDNRALVLFIDNDGNDTDPLGGGDDENTLLVNVIYSVIDV